MRKLFFATTISSALILGACSNSFIESDKEDEKQTSKKSKDEQQENNQNENTLNKENKNQISESEAIEKAKAVFNSGVYHDFKIDADRSNNSEYFITFLLNDAVGTPQKSATTVNKQSGEVGDYLDDRTEEDIENYIQFVRESPKYKGSTDKLEEQARQDKTRPNDNERESNEQSNSNEEEQQPRNKGGTAKITPPETEKEKQELKQKQEEQMKEHEQSDEQDEPEFEEPKQTQQKQEQEQPKEQETQEQETEERNVKESEQEDK